MRTRGPPSVRSAVGSALSSLVRLRWSAGAAWRGASSAAQVSGRGTCQREEEDLLQEGERKDDRETRNAKRRRARYKERPENHARRDARSTRRSKARKRPAHDARSETHAAPVREGKRKHKRESAEWQTPPKAGLQRQQAGSARRPCAHTLPETSKPAEARTREQRHRERRERAKNSVRSQSSHRAEKVRAQGAQPPPPTRKSGKARRAESISTPDRPAAVRATCPPSPPTNEEAKPC